MRHAIWTASLALAACVSQPAPQQDGPAAPTVSVFAVAHQDDWQLFMNPAAFHAMNTPGGKAVFIHVTAGDAGRGAGGEPVPYFRAREEGALRAVRFMANAANPTAALGADMEHARVDRAGRKVTRYAYANATVYFLRLPDGNIVEAGTYTPHPQSLTRLRAGETDRSIAIDGSAQYESWDQLVATLDAIVAAERVPGSGLALHLAETDETLNPGDHPDHRATALAMEDVAARLPCASVTRHDEYATRARPINVSGDDLLIDAGVWAATASGLSDAHAGSTWEPEHNAWIGRSYSRTSPPRGACD